MNKFYIRFSSNKQVTCDYICNIVQKIVSANKDIENKILVLELKDIVDLPEDNDIPKLTFKN